MPRIGDSVQGDDNDFSSSHPDAPQRGHQAGRPGLVDALRRAWGEAFHGPVADKGEIFPGLLQNESEAVTLKIKQIRKEPGCDAVLTPEISDEGFNLRRTAATKWVGLRIVKNTRAPLFSGPSLDKKTRAYFIRNNVLGVVSVSGDWINVEFPRDGKKMIIGWVRSDDVEDLQPPQKKIVSPLPPRRPMRE